MKTIFFYLLLICLGFNLVSCERLNIKDFSLGDHVRETSISLTQPKSFISSKSKLVEIATPIRLRELNKSLEQFAPQISIISPQDGRTFNRTSIDVQLEVQGLPLFRDNQFNLGPHLNLVLDDEPYREVYNTEELIAINNLSPGTHTIRVFAVTPWQESFKNSEAYAQTTFNILTATQDNRPDPNLPLLTYNQPQGTYSTQPIAIDFLLTNIPLQVAEKDNPDHGLNNLRVRVSVNGESFILDRSQPIYVEGFKEGNNWVSLELLDDQSNTVDNVFNKTVKLVNYAPQAEDPLGKLIKGEIPLEEAKSIIEENYYLQPVNTPEVIEDESINRDETVNEETLNIITSPPDKLDNLPDTLESNDNHTDPVSESTESSQFREGDSKSEKLNPQEEPIVENSVDTQKLKEEDEISEVEEESESTVEENMTSEDKTDKLPASFSLPEIESNEIINLSEDNFPEKTLETLPPKSEKTKIQESILEIGQRLKQNIKNLINNLLSTKIEQYESF